MPEHPFDVSIDHEHRVITIQGIRYAFDLFDDLAFAPKGLRVEIGERKDGAVTLLHIENTAVKPT